MRVLFVSVAAPPKGSPESLQVSKFLKYLNCLPADIHLVTERLPGKSKGWSTKETKYESLLGELAQVIEIPLFRHQFSAIFRRLNDNVLPILDEAFLFSMFTNKVIKSLSGIPDIIYSRSTPFSSALLASKLSKTLGVPWIMHLSDPWVLSPFFEGHGIKGAYHKKVEHKCFEQADMVTFTSVDQITMYESKYPQHKSKFRWFPNVFDDDEVVLEDISTCDNGITFLHTGNFYGPGRSPLPILKAVDHLYRNEKAYLENVKFSFTGHMEPSLREIFRRYNTLPVEHIGVLTLDEVLHLQKNSQVLIIIDWALPKEKAVFLLSKAIDYIATGKPILAITTKGSTVYQLVEGVYGRCFEHDDLEGILGYLKYLIDGLRKNDQVVLKPYLADQKYSARNNASELFELMQSLQSN
jgi:glycosyltransferase involved in cell wall biosynthesis